MYPEPNKRIMIIDDEQYICRIIVEILSEPEFDITSFTDPKDALEFLANNPVDLVLSDLLMGEYSGLQILEAAQENQRDAVVILMTAHPTVQTAISALRRGAYDLLVKPFKLEMLSATIKRGLNHQKILRDNISLNGQVEFLKAANAFLGSDMKLDTYLRLVLRSCNTELGAEASVILETDPASGDIIQQIHAPEDILPPVELLRESLIEQFRDTCTTKPVIISQPVEVDGHQMCNILISSPIFIRGSLHGVLNSRCISRSDTITCGQLSALSILANSAASAIANQNLYKDLKKSYLHAFSALANAIEARDRYTAGHTGRVTLLAEQMATHLGWDEQRLQTLHFGCTLHDIGKIGVPDAILNKTGKLTAEERHQMQQHPQLGLKVIREIDLFKPSIPYIIAHHERYDGKGYPHGLEGDDIPIEGRLLAVADTFDAIMSDRPYRRGAALDVAVSEIIEHSGTQFDPEIVIALLEVLRAGKIDLRELYDREDDPSCLGEVLTTETALAPAK